MKTTVTKLEENKVRLDVEVEMDEMGDSLDRAARELSRKVSLKGFRKGRIPRKVLERHVGREAIAEEAIRYAVPRFLADAILAEDLDIIGRPEVDAVEGGVEGPLTFAALVDTRPELVLGDLSEVEVRLDETVSPTEEEVDHEVDTLRKRFATTEEVARPARRGDHVLVNMEAHVHSEAIEELSRQDFLYEIGSATLIPALDEQIEGSRPGEILKFTTTLSGESSFRPGEDAAFTVLVKAVKESRLPDLDDDFVSESSEFDTVDELKDDIRRTLALVKRRIAMQQAQDRLIDVLVERTGLKVPDAVVGEEVDARMTGAARDLARQGYSIEEYVKAGGSTVEELRERLRPDAVHAVQASLIIRAMAEEFDIKASEAEVDAEIEGLAARTGEPPAKERRRLEKASQISSVAGDIIRTKALRHLLESVVVVDASGEPVDLTVPPDAPAGEAAELSDNEGENAEASSAGPVEE